MYAVGVRMRVRMCVRARVRLRWRWRLFVFAALFLPLTEHDEPMSMMLNLFLSSSFPLSRACILHHFSHHKPLPPLHTP